MALHKVIENDCDQVILQFKRFLDNVVTSNKSAFTSFNKHDQRVDGFVMDHLLPDAEEYKDLIPVIQRSLVLSHGQAAVERGFSTNKQIEVENLKLHSLIAQRQICDFKKSIQNPLDIVLPRKLLKMCSEARGRYKMYQDNEKKKKEAASGTQKRKTLQSELDFLMSKKSRLDADISSMLDKAQKLSFEAESKRLRAALNSLLKLMLFLKEQMRTKLFFKTQSKALAKRNRS